MSFDPNQFYRNAIIFILSALLFLPVVTGTSQEPAPPTGLEIQDTPSDSGETLLLTWPAKESYNAGEEYIIYRSDSPDGPFEEIDRFKADFNYKSDYPAYFGYKAENDNYHAYKASPIWEMIEREIKDGKGEKKIFRRRGEAKETYYKIGFSDGETLVKGNEVVSGTPKQNWFRADRLNSLVFLILMFLFVMHYIAKAQKDPNIFLRKIPGIDAVDEAVGRATEMGKPILYSTGYYDIQEVSTICSVNILAHVAKKVAQYDSRLLVPSKWPVAMTVCQEVVREAYINAGRPDAFNINDIFFVAGEQFSYTIGVDSLMVRERPAANFFMGTFAAEALILAETGATTGAIQIAGTDSNYQIPFFVVACDYCLIGEELYAASAYLSRNPKLIGSLKAQDAGKMILFFAVLIGTILVTIGAFYPDAEIFDVVKQFFTVR